MPVTSTNVPTIAPITASAEHSRFVQRVRRRYGGELARLAPGTPDAATVGALIDELGTAGHAMPDALRITRALVLERLAVLDVEQAAPLAVVTQTMTTLAEVTLERALTQAQADADARHGAPLNASGQRIDFWIVGMGKLGARELNVSSDIDLVYLYEEDGATAGAPGGDTQGQRATSAHEYFAYVAKRLQALIGDTTEHGFVFRMDLALRPNGNSGPPVVSLAMLEEYLQVQGREWERFAWLKSRVIAPRSAVESGRALPLRALITPFVYRRYLDYGVFESLRQLHAKIREEALRRAAGRPGRNNDVKLSRGGIREIEFVVQLLLVVRGGQFPEIRTRSTLKALQALVHHGLMPAETASALAESYNFLRRVEHRIQFLDDQQTHLLPSDDADLAWIATSMGLPDGPAAGQPANPGCALLARLGEVRERVAAEFDTLLGDTPAPDTAGCRNCGGTALDDPALLEQLPTALADRVRPWLTQSRFAMLREDSRLRLGRLMQRTAQHLAAGECSEDAALRFIDWIEPLLRRESYFSLLIERAEVHRRLLRVLGLARWPMQMLMRRPGVIDELADERLLAERFDRSAFVAELESRREAWQRSGEASEEQLLDTLRRAHHAEVFRTLVRDVEGRITVEQVADDLSALADAVLDTTLRWAWALHRGKHREEPQLAVIAYGKLGGKELGYGSDLDVVFIYDDREEADRDRAQEVYGGFVRKLITWLTLRTAVGELFDIDTALRPNGSSGLLVTSLESFERYQVGRGGNTAWTWEHQAITRARFCAGAAALEAPVEAVRRAVLAAPRDHAALRQEVRAMREKVRAARPVPSGRFDVKHSAGGMMDVEFAVQWLVLAHAQSHPELVHNVGNIALLQRAEAAGLLPPGVGQQAANAYRELRRAQHRARLDEQPTQFDPAQFADAALAVQRLWNAVFA